MPNEFNIVPHLSCVPHCRERAAQTRVLFTLPRINSIKLYPLLNKWHSHFNNYLHRRILERVRTYEYIYLRACHHYPLI